MSSSLHTAQELLNTVMRWQSEPDQATQDLLPAGLEAHLEQLKDLPLGMAYVDDEREELVVGLAGERDREDAGRALRALLGDVPLRLSSVQVTRDDAPAKKEDCRPIWGGVRMNSGATIAVVYKLSDGPLGTILSSHAVGEGTGQTVGQAAITSAYGKVTINPSLKSRYSDSALAVITNTRIGGEPNKIWAAPNTAYTVNDYAISSNTPLRLVIYMQGAQTPELQRGVIWQKGVTIKDARGVLYDQVLATYSAQSGDSGAPIFYMTEYPGYVVFVGLHAGRIIEDETTYAYYSTWEAIRAELKLPQYKGAEVSAPSAQSVK